jgi:hypothetical protein
MTDKVLRDDHGYLTFPTEGKIAVVVADLHEQGEEAGMSDEEIEALVAEFLTIAYQRGLH